MSIYKKISDFHKEVGAIHKDANNPFHKSKYATIESVLQTIGAPMARVGLAFVQLPQADGLKTIISDTDSDDKIESFVPYLLAKDDMQGLGSAITYARRYALVSMLGLEQEDDDANQAVTSRQANNNQTKKPPKQSGLREVLQKHNIGAAAFAKFANIKTEDDAEKLYNDKGALSDMISKFKDAIE